MRVGSGSKPSWGWRSAGVLVAAMGEKIEHLLLSRRGLGRGNGALVDFVAENEREVGKREGFGLLEVEKGKERWA